MDLYSVFIEAAGLFIFNKCKFEPYFFSIEY